jgi:hypothetical protein
MNNIRKIGLKYCGGCSPRYDRVKQVERMKEELGGTIEFVPPECEDAECILVISGCKTACADITTFSNRSVRFITSEEDVTVWIEEMKQSKKNRKKFA